MVKEVHVEGYEKLKELLDTLKNSSGSVNILFTGKKDQNGISWCPDCNVADPVIKEGIKKYAPADSHFIHVDVGDRAYWKDQQNPFRHDISLGKIQVIPTLICWKTPKRLEGDDQLAKIDLLEMFFENDDD